jgi:hypothetical protein
MTSEGGYPARGDNWAGALAQYRCASECGARRCQLYVGHDVAHAHAWLEARPAGYARRSGAAYPWRAHLIRWDDSASWSEACGVERLRWCCMFSV